MQTSHAPDAVSGSIVEPTAVDLDIFISHCTADAVAKEFFELIRDEVYGGDEELVAQRVFFSSDGPTGLRAGEKFGVMLEKLDGCKRVLAVMTQNTARSVAVHAEMALAAHHKKLLPVVARHTFQSMLTWPFESTHAAALDRPDEIHALLGQLAKIVDRPFPTTPNAKKRCQQLAETARRTCEEPRTRARRWPLVLGALILAGLSFGAGTLSLSPERVVIDERPLYVSGTPVKLILHTTFPQSLLSRRLHDIFDALGDDTSSSQIHRLFLDALEAGNVHQFDDAALQDLRQIVAQWRSGGSGIDHRNDGQPCASLPKQIDREWCAAIERLLANERDRDVFDDTPFAVIKKADGYEALTTGGHIEFPDRRWKVAKISGAVTIEPEE